MDGERALEPFSSPLAPTLPPRNLLFLFFSRWIFRMSIVGERREALLLKTSACFILVLEERNGNQSTRREEGRRRRMAVRRKRRRSTAEQGSSGSIGTDQFWV